MATTIHELFTGRRETIGDKPKAEVAYVVLDARDETEVKAIARASIPSVYAGLPLRSITVDERFSATAWKVLADYEPFEPQQTTDNAPTFSFDTGGGTQHITQSIQTVGRYGPAASTALGGAIGYDGQNVAGVDITVPVFQFSEVHVFDPTTITGAYQGTLFGVTGAINDAPFRGFAAGEVLFLGASGTRRGVGAEDPWDITYKFAAAPNESSLTVGSITGIQKRGWDYLWVQYGDDVDLSAKVLIKKPIAVYVEQVYRSASFGLLGIGA